MTEIYSYVNSPAWWFGTVIMAFLINMLSAYAKPTTDRLFSRASTKWRDRTERTRQEAKAQIAHLVYSPVALQADSESEVRIRLQTITLFLMIIMLLLCAGMLNVMPPPPSSWVSQQGVVSGILTITLVMLFFVMMTHREAMRLSFVIRGARHALKALERHKQHTSKLAVPNPGKP